MGNALLGLGWDDVGGKESYINVWEGKTGLGECIG